MDPREVISAMLGAAVGLLIAIIVMVAFPPQAEVVVEEVLVEVPTPVLFMIGVPGAPVQLSENEELGAWSDPAGEFYCFPVGS